MKSAAGGRGEYHRQWGLPRFRHGLSDPVEGGDVVPRMAGLFLCPPLHGPGTAMTPQPFERRDR